MTREEAISILYSDIDNKSCDGCQILCRNLKCPVNEALEMAIKALEQEPCEDAISRQAVFEQINCWIGSGEYKYTNAMHYLTERVKHISTVNPQEPSGDAVSRQAIDEIKELMTDINGDTVYAVRMSDLRQLPPFNPQKPKTGHWITTRTIMHDGEYYCDKCKCDAPHNEKWDYCPNCGCRMIEP